MNIYEIPIIQTASSGVWSFNTGRLVSSILLQIVAKAATTTTTFGVRITDIAGNIIYESDYATGTLREEVYIPIKDICTVAAFDSSADEAYTGKLAIEEED